MTEQQKVIDHLNQSSGHPSEVMRNQPEGGLRRPATMFKQQTSMETCSCFEQPTLTSTWASWCPTRE
jgi:hypothetical protein